MKKELAKAYEPQKYEDKIYQRWEESGLFNPDNLDLKKDTKSYCVVLPPPNVTGTLHLGHAAMLAIEDILVRYHRMKGERTLWVPGTDHAAIATQTKVEKIIKKEGTSRHELGRDKFLERVEKFAQQSHDRIVNQVKKMGASIDWSREAYTLDKTRHKAVYSVFKMMYDDGLIYRGERIVNWCPRCHSTLADDEVEYKAQRSTLYTFKYSKDFPFAIATTRPETKLGDTAVAVNPDDERYKKYINKTYEVDFVGQKLKLKIISDRQIDKDFGTGALGVTPAHAMLDWIMAEKNKLDIIKVIDEDGKIRDGFGKYSGQDVYAARKAIVKKLKKQGLIEKEDEIDNNISLCYRCDTPIEPLPSLQWFIDVNKPLRGKIQNLRNKKQIIDWEGKSIKDVCLEVVRDKKIKIIPERFEKNYFHWMENLRDWCISRQIWYGHRVPVWYKSTINNLQLTVNNNKDEIYVGVEAPKGDGWTQDEDTLDTWFSSGLWTFSTLAHSPEEINLKNNKLEINSDDFKNFHPTQVLETGYDILFFWVARMIIMTTYAVKDIPFEDVYLHGLVLDDKGKKMSKSKGNVIDPLDMVDKYGTDATRLSLIVGSAPGNDMRLNEEKIAGFRNFANKLWNISRFILSKSEENDVSIPSGSPRPLGSRDNLILSLADKWILEKLDNLIISVTKNLEKYQFSQAGENLREFTWSDLADWYLEASKFEKNENKASVLNYILETILKLWHPFIPFVTEVIWSEMGKEKALMVEKWPQRDTSFQPAPFKGEGEQAGDFEIVKDIVTAVRNARAENKVEPGKKIKAVVYGGEYKDLIESQADIIKSLRTGIEKLEVKKMGAKIDDAIYIALGQIEIYLIGAVDKEKEKARIKKEISKLENVILNIKKKLENKEFVSRAPKVVVNKEKDKLAQYEEELKNLRDR